MSDNVRGRQGMGEHRGPNVIRAKRGGPPHPSRTTPTGPGHVTGVQPGCRLCIHARHEQWCKTEGCSCFMGHAIVLPPDRKDRR